MESRPQPLEKCHRVIQHPLNKKKKTLNGSGLPACAKTIKQGNNSKHFTKSKSNQHKYLFITLKRETNSDLIQKCNALGIRA